MSLSVDAYVIYYCITTYRIGIGHTLVCDFGGGIKKRPYLLG